MSLRECEVVCKDNCSCTVYANPNMTTSGVGCLRWFGDLINVRVYALRQDLYVRQAAFELSSKVNTLNLIMHFVLYIERVYSNYNYSYNFSLFFVKLLNLFLELF
ncbi:putative non-specific serine/threonine protein kinase [Helianthus annuus]|nr:putative non-specific serine/threonine protein kinase [Helianthus annuus]KAJ0654821.1 putative non-specific serine/threonine protein kinase [Helianthus annuus]